MHSTKMGIHPLPGPVGAGIPGVDLAAGIDDETFGRNRAGPPRQPSGGTPASGRAPVFHMEEKDRRARGYIGGRR